LTKNRLCILGENNIFYIVDVDNGNQLLLTFTLPYNKAITHFDIDQGGFKVLFVASTGEIYVYSIQTLLAAE
jgi:hypothetical protein